MLLLGMNVAQACWRQFKSSSTIQTESYHMIQKFSFQIYNQENEKHMSTQNMYMCVHSSAIHNSPKEKQPKCPPTDEGINNMRSVQWGGGGTARGDPVSFRDDEMF